MCSMPALKCLRASLRASPQALAGTSEVASTINARIPRSPRRIGCGGAYSIKEGRNRNVRFTYRAIVAYDGSRYCGFSLQPGERTVESVLLEALRPIVPELPRIACGGRTDRGVHATAQTLSFYAREALACETIASALDAADPDYLAVREVRLVPNRFH